MKTALITGITGMDGSHLADFLLSIGYTVFGLERRSSTKNRTNISHIENRINLLTGDLSDQNSLVRALEVSKPDEVYNLAAQSFVGESWNTPEQTSNITGLGVLRMLEAIRQTNKNIKFYQAGSSEMFGKMVENPSKEDSHFYPRSPYGVAKIFGHYITKNYRESYGIFACNGILFNHESERRGMEFVTRKITDGVAKIKLGLSNSICLGNIEAKRDWGYAPDYVEAMWKMLQQSTPDDYVIATNTSRSVKDFIIEAFNCAGIAGWESYVTYDKAFVRPAEVDCLRGDYNKASLILNWQPKTTFKELVKVMVENDIKRLRNVN